MTTFPSSPLASNPIDDSPPEWSYDYRPYQLQDGTELPAFEIYDHRGEKLFDTNEDLSLAQQEAAAQLAVAAPALHAALTECLRLLADFDVSPGDEGDVYRYGLSVLAMCPARTRAEET